MTRQQAEELTVSAQKYLRMMHFNKIHLVLNMEPLPRKVGWDKRKNKKSEGDKKESEEARGRQCKNFPWRGNSLDEDEKSIQMVKNTEITMLSTFYCGWTGAGSLLADWN